MFSNTSNVPGLQISLNYLMEFNAKLVPNSSRIPNECDLLCARTYTWICCFCCFLASAKRVALAFGGHLGQVRPALRQDFYMYLLLLLLLGQCKAGRARFLGVTSDRCDLLCAKRVALIPLVGKFPQVSPDSSGCWAEI